MKASSKSIFARACNSLASMRKMRSSLSVRTNCWKRRWQVWYGGYLLGSSRHCAPVPNTHRISVEHRSRVLPGRPRPSARRCGLKIGSMSFHWASLRSHRPRML